MWFLAFLARSSKAVSLPNNLERAVRDEKRRRSEEEGELGEQQVKHCRGVPGDSNFEN
jgi:hypothetical protein